MKEQCASQPKLCLAYIVAETSSAVLTPASPNLSFWLASYTHGGMQCKQRCVMICSLSEHVLLWHGTGDLRKNRRKRWLSKTGHLATSMWCLGITKAGKAHNARTRQVPAAAKLCCYGCWGFIHFFSLKGWSVDINEKTRTRSSNPSHSTAKNRNMQNRSKQYLFISFHFFVYHEIHDRLSLVFTCLHGWSWRSTGIPSALTAAPAISLPYPAIWPAENGENDVGSTAVGVASCFSLISKSTVFQCTKKAGF